ncbi:MAG: DAK2 domain-containing protein, partial [Corynebacterium sp.]|nr:DAK2 domain-containing protein [Corynebacterium sp.]
MTRFEQTSTGCAPLDTSAPQSSNQLDAHQVLAWARRSVAELSRRRTELNKLNVFPVPDSDTGSNMTHTMAAAVAEAELGGDVAEALAIGSARGARGNSGIVLSQVLRAVADSTDNSVITAEDIVESLVLAVELVDKAIAQPVEGTVVTVLRAAAHGAQAFVEKEHASTPSV